MPAGEAFASPAGRALADLRVPMIRVTTVAGVKIATGEGDLAERAQTLEFGCLVHPYPPLRGVSGNSRQSTADVAVGASLRQGRTQ